MTSGEGTGGPPPGSEPAEISRLRAEVARLQARRHGRGARIGRWSAATVILLVAAVLFCLSLVAVFVRSELLNTDRYVATVAPLARDPAVQDAITARLTNEFMTRVDVQGLAKQLTTNLEQHGAPPVLNNLVGPITSGVQSFLSSQIHRVVTSDAFAQLWDNANRTAHSEIDAVLTTGHGELLTANGTQVSLNLGGLLDMVKQKLVAAGFTLAAKVPDTNVTVPLFTSDALPRIRTAVSTLETLAWVLPLVSLLLLLAGILIAPDHRRGFVLGAVLFFVLLLILLGGLAFVRTYYLNHLPPAVQSPDAVRVLYDTVTRFLVQATQTLLVLLGIVVVVAWAAGPSRPARLLRRGIDAGLDAGGHGLARTGVSLGPVPAALRRYRQAIAVAAVVLALVILVLWRTPGIAGVVWLTVAVLALLALLEVVARAGPDQPRLRLS